MSNYIQGERFLIPLDDDETADGETTTQSPPHDPDHSTTEQSDEPDSATFMVADVLERVTRTGPKPPAPPTFKPASAATGFPRQRKFAEGRVSRFKSVRQPAQTGLGEQGPSPPAATPPPSNKGTIDLKAIDEENRNRLASMSTEEINDARGDIMSMLNPELIARLMKRNEPFLTNGSWNSGTQPTVAAETTPTTDPKETDHATPAELLVDPQASRITATQKDEAPVDKQLSTEDEGTTAKKMVTFDIPEPESKDKPKAESTENFTHDPLASMHFPQAPAPPKLDQSSPNFLTDLQSHYFPAMPHDPSKLDWLSHVTSDPKESLPSSIPVSHLRFDLDGKIIPPSVQTTLPVILGLHHHGDDPDRAGYKISELAILARSLFPTQRCLSILILGRILWRLGSNEFGRLEEEEEEEGTKKTSKDEVSEQEQKRQEELSELALALEDHMEKQQIVNILLEELRLDGRGHASAKAYVSEAVWLWRQAGAPAWVDENERKSEEAKGTPLTP